MKNLFSKILDSPLSNYEKQKRKSNKKIYFEDLTIFEIRKNLDFIINYLNTQKIKPKYWAIDKSEEEIKEFSDLDISFIKNKKNKSLELKFVLDKDENFIIAQKKYLNREEAYLDLIQTLNFLEEKTKITSIETIELRDNLGQNFSMYMWDIFVDEKALDENILRFTIKKEFIRKAMIKETKKIVSFCGCQITNSPKDSDYAIYFEITRNYYENELKEIKKKKKDLGFEVDFLFLRFSDFEENDFHIPLLKIVDLKTYKSNLCIPTLIDSACVHMDLKKPYILYNNDFYENVIKKFIKNIF